MFSDQPFWSIFPGAEQDIARRLQAYLQRLQVGDGPATDAERDGLPVHVDGGIAVIDIAGVMIRSAGFLASLFGFTGTNQIRLALESALVDPDVDGILLRIDSPGGSVAGLDRLIDAFEDPSKPIVAQVDGMAASAAYFVASRADSIMAGRTDLVGSIGTRMVMFDFSKAFENEGIETVVIDTGEFKSAGTIGTEITEAQRADFQRIVDFYFDDFVMAVADGREMSTDAVREVADGRVFTPPEAISNGLIDGVATFEATLRNMQAGRPRRTDSAKAQLRM